MRRQPRRTYEARIQLVDSLIDTFMAQPHRPITGKTLAQVTADLLRTPPLTKQLGHHSAKLIVGIDPATVLACPPRCSTSMSVEGAIPAAGSHVAP